MHFLLVFWSAILRHPCLNYSLVVFKTFWPTYVCDREGAPIAQNEDIVKIDGEAGVAREYFPACAYGPPANTFTIKMRTFRYEHFRYERTSPSRSVK